MAGAGQLPRSRDGRRKLSCFSFLFSLLICLRQVQHHPVGDKFTADRGQSPASVAVSLTHTITHTHTHTYTKTHTHTHTKRHRDPAETHAHTHTHPHTYTHTHRLSS